MQLPSKFRPTALVILIKPQSDPKGVQLNHLLVLSHFLSGLAKKFNFVVYRENGLPKRYKVQELRE